MVSTPDPVSRFTVQQGVIECQIPLIQISTSTASKHIRPFSEHMQGAGLGLLSLEASKLSSAISLCLRHMLNLLS